MLLPNVECSCCSSFEPRMMGKGRAEGELALAPCHCGFARKLGELGAGVSASE